MKFFVAVTDNEWFHYLARFQPDEVNFWNPSGSPMKNLQVGELVLFKLHRKDYITGGGWYVQFSQLPLSIAWEAFQQKNGVDSYSSFYEKIRSYRESHQGPMQHDPVIGCTILSQPFFLDESDWIPLPEGWSPNIVRGKTYDTENPSGAIIWNRVQAYLSNRDEKLLLVKEPGAQYGSEYLVRARLGQGSFRILVTEAYSRKCAMTEEKTLPVLQAAHIKPYSCSGPNMVNNGLLLRADLHILFDKGYITITRDYHIEVSKKIVEEFDNGKNYYKLHGERLKVLPLREQDKPSKEFIEWHNQKVFIG